MTRPEAGGESRPLTSQAGASQAGGHAGAGYAGDLSPQAAWDLLRGDSAAVLVDCRSQAEWSFVGVPDLSAAGKHPVLIEWQSFVPGTPDTGGQPRMLPNRGFAQDLERAGVAKDAAVVFICRSGGRSRSAAIAMTQAGWQRCYNLAGGFEGAHDATHHRGTAEGWKAAGLPWVQD
jgi:rhodanese-related sulfurtransferase